MAGGSHNGSCANATGHQCKCGGCGGALHGWQGWVDLARSDDARDRRRGQLEGKLGRDPRSGKLRSNRANRGHVADLARLDITDWLAARNNDPGSNQTGGRPDIEREPAGRRSDATTGLVGQRRESSSELTAQLSDLDLVEQFGRQLTKDTWPKIANDLDTNITDAAKIRKQLAHHTWCDLLIALVRLVESATRLTNEIRAKAEEAITRMILKSSKQDERRQITERILGTVVGRVLTALTAATVAHVPMLQLLTGEKALRALRILAVFACPAPEDHAEVRKHALEPLATDSREILTEQTKKRLGELLPTWLQEP